MSLVSIIFILDIATAAKVWASIVAALSLTMTVCKI